MEINEDTKLTQQFVCFTDGRDGYFTEEFAIFADDKETGVSMIVDSEGRAFIHDDKVFKTVKEAFEHAGYKWNR